LPVNLARVLFLDPRASDFYVDWEKAANDAVAILRGEASRDPYDRRLPDWSGSCARVASRSVPGGQPTTSGCTAPGLKRDHHPVAGDLELTYEALELPADTGLAIITYTAEPGSASQDALDFLASWAAVLDQPETAQTPNEA